MITRTLSRSIGQTSLWWRVEGDLGNQSLVNLSYLSLSRETYHPPTHSTMKGSWQDLGISSANQQEAGRPIKKGETHIPVADVERGTFQVRDITGQASQQDQSKKEAPEE